MQYPKQTEQSNQVTQQHQNVQNTQQVQQQYNYQQNGNQNNQDNQYNNYENNEQININFAQFNQGNDQNMDDHNETQQQRYQNNQFNQQNGGGQQQQYYFHDYNQQNQNNEEQTTQNRNVNNNENQQRYYFHDYNDLNNQQSNQQVENQEQIHQNNKEQQKLVETATQEVQTKQINQQILQTNKLEQQLLRIKLIAAELEQQLKKQKQTLTEKQKQNETERLLFLQKQRERQKERQIEKQKQLQRQKQKKQQRKRQQERLKQQQADEKRQKQLQQELQREKKKLKQKDQQRQKQREQQRKQQAAKIKQLNKQQKQLQKQKQKVEKMQKYNRKKEQILILKQEQIQKQKKEIEEMKQQEVIKKQKEKKKKKKDKDDKKNQAQPNQNLKNEQKQIKKQNATVTNNPYQETVVIKKQQNPNQNSSPQPPRSGSNNSVFVVPVSQITEPSQTLIIKQAQKQRIQSTLKLFIQYTGKHRLHINNQKSVLLNVYQQIDRRKSTKYVWYHLIKQYLSQYQNLAKSFHETSYKINKQQKVQNANKYLNIGQQLKQATDQLIFLRKQSGNDYNRINDYISSKINIQLQVTFNKFISQMNKAQYNLNEKKKACLELEEQFRKRIQKLTKVYNKGREGKQQQEDVFVQTCKFIQFQRQFKYSLITWGKGLIQLRKIFILLQNKLNQEVQSVLNSFKNASAIIYSFHQQKFDKIISSKDQIARDDRFCKLCALADNDYIKYAIQISEKISLAEVEDKYFQYFTQMPHFELITGKPEDLLKGMVNKSFQLKNINEQLINTISGNLVQYNRQTSQYLNTFIIKNLSATIVAEGVIQFDQLLPGIIFNDHRTIRIAFKDQDRAEQLICLLNQKSQS